jgi:hypothetical protein
MSQSTLLVMLLWGSYLGWLVAGWFDFHWRRRDAALTDDALRDAGLHVMMLGQVGLGLVATLLFLPTPPLLLMLLALAIAHLLTSVADTRRAENRRRIGASEPLVHALADGLPLLGLALYVVLNASYFDESSLAANAWALQWRTPALGAGVWAAVLAPAIVFALGPGLVAYVLAWRARRLREANA